jgi:hypothetical protein
VITVALDHDPEAAREWIEAAKPAHPSLIDTSYVLADLYNMVNVPTVLWIAEDGRIVRPNDVSYVTDTFTFLHGIDPEEQLGRIRAWVRDGVSAIAPDEVGELQTLPSETTQLARAHFGLGMWLRDRDRLEAAERHFVRAGELAPHDFTIRRGSMPMRGIDSMGERVIEMVMDWRRQGRSYYEPLPR